MGTILYVKVRRLPSGKTRIDLEIQSNEIDHGAGTLQLSAQKWELLKTSLPQLVTWLDTHGASIDLVEIDLQRGA